MLLRNHKTPRPEQFPVSENLFKVTALSLTNKSHWRSDSCLNTRKYLFCLVFSTYQLLHIFFLFWACLCGMSNIHVTGNFHYNNGDRAEPRCYRKLIKPVGFCSVCVSNTCDLFEIHLRFSERRWEFNWCNAIALNMFKSLKMQHSSVQRIVGTPANSVHGPTLNWSQM